MLSSVEHERVCLTSGPGINIKFKIMHIKSEKWTINRQQIIYSEEKV